MPQVLTADKNAWLIPAERYQFESESVTYAVRWLGATSLSTDNTKVYKNGEDVTSDVLSGSASFSGNIHTLKTLGSLKGGERYVLSVSAVVDGDTEVRSAVIYGKFRYDVR